MNFYWNSPQVYFLKQRMAPFTVLQILDFMNFLEDFTCKLFSKYILSSDKWNSLNKVKGFMILSILKGVFMPYSSEICGIFG